MNYVANTISWATYTCNPIKGLCQGGCWYCYARRMYKRFKWNSEIRFEPTVFIGLPKNPSRIFVGSTFELFGDWVKPEWMERIFRYVKLFPRHTFIFLTKCPQNLIKWSPFPENCWIGVSTTNLKQYREACIGLSVIQAKVKFLSIEPLLEHIPMQPTYEPAFDFCNWVIIGQQTPIKKSTMPKIEWIQEIVRACDKTGIPVFLKDNLKSILPIANPFYRQYGVPMYEIILRQEFSDEKNAIKTSK